MPDFDTRKSTFARRFSHNIQVQISRLSHDSQLRRVGTLLSGRCNLLMLLQVTFRRLVLVLVTGCLATWYFWSTRERSSYVAPYQPPEGLPGYEQIYQFEDALPQHNLDLPSPEGKTGRYVKFSNQYRGTGWNNVNVCFLNASYRNALTHIRF